MNHFLFGTEPPMPAPHLHSIDKRRFPHAHKMATLSYSHNTPSNIIGQANDNWKNTNKSIEDPSPAVTSAQLSRWNMAEPFIL